MIYLQSIFDSSAIYLCNLPLTYLQFVYNSSVIYYFSAIYLQFIVISLPFDINLQSDSEMVKDLSFIF